MSKERRPYLEYLNLRTTSEVEAILEQLDDWQNRPVEGSDGVVPQWSGPLPEDTPGNAPAPPPGVSWSTPVVQFPFPGMVMDTATNEIRWEKPGDKYLYRPVGQWSVDQRLLTAFFHSLKHLDPEARKQLALLFTGENLAFFSGVLALWAASHFVGVGEVVDAALLVLAVAGGGAQAVTIAIDLWDFIEQATNAKSADDLRRAGEHMARVIVAVGVDTIMAVFFKKAKLPKRIDALARRIEDAGLPGLQRSLSDIPIRKFTELDLEIDMRFRAYGSLRMGEYPIVPPGKVGSGKALRRAAMCSGMHCAAVMHVQAAAMMSPEKIAIDVRPAGIARRFRGLKKPHPGKPVWIEPNTITEADIALGAPRHGVGQVGWFKPRKPHPDNKVLMERWELRNKQWNDPQMQKVMQDQVNAGVIHIENGVVIESKSGLSLVGDYDLFAVRRADDLRLIPESHPTHRKVLEILGFNPVKLEHNSLTTWAPKTEAHMLKRQALITRHIDEVPLIRFKFDGSVWYAWADPSDF